MKGRLRRGLAMAGLVAALSCRGSAGLHGEGAPANHVGDEPTAAQPGAAAEPTGKPRGPVSEAEGLKPRPDLPPARRALVMLGAAPAAPSGQGGARASAPPPPPPEERWIDGDMAEAASYTLVDFSDGWTPFIFDEQVGADGQPLPN